MTICGVRFKEGGKVYYFNPLDITFSVGDKVIVGTTRGVELGEIAIANRNEDIPADREIKPVIRKAREDDIRKYEENKVRAAAALEKCKERVAAHGLEMKLVEAEYTFDGSKLLFYFTADGRVDFRELVKDLAGVFRTRIELRQIGVRDESKIKGGIGICGNPFCCKRFLGEFHPVSVKMAKEQGIALLPSKISGTCGRLMCCLKYEQDAYEELIANTPKVGAYVQTPSGQGNVTEVNLLRGRLKVQIGKEGEATVKTFDKDEVKVLRDGRIQVSREEAEAVKDLEDK